MGIKRVFIPKKGKKSQAQTAQEKQRWFRRLQAWRAGGEGTISILKRKYGLGRSLSRGWRSKYLGGIWSINVQLEANSSLDLRNQLRKGTELRSIIQQLKRFQKKWTRISFHTTFSGESKYSQPLDNQGFIFSYFTSTLRIVTSTEFTLS